MKEIILQELNSILNLNRNICYKQITKINNELHIKKSNYSGSSIIEIREISDIQAKLEKFNDYFEINILSDIVILKFK